MNLKVNKDIKSVLRKSHSNMGWGLCIGAGTSFPIFPSWHKLVENLVKRDTMVGNPASLAQSLLDKFSPDSLIQAAQNRLNLSDSDFASILAEELYSNLKLLSGTKWDSIRKILESRNPSLERDPIWRDYIDVRENEFKKTSAYTIGKFVHKTMGIKIPPDVIVSFNAESLLFSLINSFEREKFLGKTKKTGELVTILDRLTHSVSSFKRNTIKYIFCHGLLNAPLTNKKSPFLTATDKLVFSESAYLNLSNSTFSWQSSEFISSCLNRTIVFIGVSLTDPNMRRWLSWIQKSKETEVKENLGLTKSTLDQMFSHYWINLKPKNSDEVIWIESCVKHLGVQIIWLNSWSDLGNVLETMIA